ncbi:amino acid--[acyl-carrier-protein] ligase [Lichenicola cladoniae]|uniref:Amino acid--[acyl-carrier-protein] ligase n=1 Tax=Lichenicola cladoniae TaxID=1484109 RepID=A0A6M8HJU8_9PROT|nr:amino acid--[acyl-carrier-protein] ligase [Lichenicola cladoniae]NPD65152.1 amino acid--[acyl-carrier-protein] ligase [Acetobacteraceae bacterium]QKE88756.1 amino acid--[acyl-carrier-protein] ligase [Lichenicola cladoniae]
MSAETAFRDELIEARILIPSGVDGVFGRSGLFESIVDGIDSLITRNGQDQDAEIVRFPPAMPRSVMETSGYLNGFPHLAGTVHCFCGDERAHQTLLRCLEAGEDWTEGQKCVDLTLTPAACYPVYPMIAGRGALPQGGCTVDVASYCFRHEPSLDPTRMQLFRMREFVRLGSPSDVQAFRDNWVQRGKTIIGDLGLPVAIDLANDPFFGRGGTFMASSQRDQALKFELLVPVTNPEKPTACLSFNYHMDHFSEVWNLRLADGELAHTACVGFGFERLTLALLRHHGFDISSWPQSCRKALWNS